MDLPSD